MALTHVELYEALKGRLGERAAALIADVVPAARDLATKTDIAELSAKIDVGFAQIRTLRWMLGLFLPMWFGTWVTLVALVLKH